MARVDEIKPGIYRISQFDPRKRMEFNQFLIRDDASALVHTGTYPMYESVRDAVREVMDPALLRYVVIPHWEADECGGIERFLERAPGAKLVCSRVGYRINLTGWRVPEALPVWQDDAIDLGRHRLRFLMSPHVHHWDSMMALEETEGVLFPADLYAHPGEQPPVSSENLADEMIQWYRWAGFMPSEAAVHRVLDRLEREPIRHIAPMHGASIPAAALAPYTRALREQPFAFDGRLFGEEVLT